MIGALSLKMKNEEYYLMCFQGKSVDVRNGDSVRALVAFAKETLGCIDIWV
jgi:hypothetical protein